MARDFNPATPQYLERTITLVAGYPFSIVAWAYKDVADVAGAIAGLTDDATNLSELIFDAGEGIRASSLFDEAISSGAGSINTWTHAAGVWASATSRTAYRDGGNSGTNTSNIAAGTKSVIRIGHGFVGISDPFPGALAEVAVYNIALSADEIAMLARGVCPLAVRPEALVAYVPLIGRASAEPDLIAGGTMTHVSTPSQFAHPRIFYPGRAKLIIPVSSAAPQDLTPSLFTNTNTFYAATVAPGAVALTPDLFTNTNTFYTAVVAFGTQDLTPDLFENENTFYTAIVAATYAITPERFENENTFGAATVAPGAVDLTPELFENENIFYSAQVVDLDAVGSFGPWLDRHRTHWPPAW